MTGPQENELWQVGSYQVTFVGVARDFAQERQFIWKFAKGPTKFFVCSKDEFYSLPLSHRYKIK